MTTRGKVAVLGAIALVAVGAFFLMGNKGGIPVVGGIFDPEPTTCPLSGIEPQRAAALERSAVAIKVENAPVAYPLSGLEDAEVVYEELVEGGVTRFLALYHCSDSDKVGPVRSARIVDPAIMTPATRILAFSGANKHVLDALDAAEIVQLDEDNSGGALARVPRAGIGFEHTLYGDISELRKVARESFDDAPPAEAYSFGEISNEGTRRAAAVVIDFSGVTSIRYEWDGERWLRYQAGQPFMAESGEQIAVENVLIEEHEVNLSGSITDVSGNPSVEIGDVTGQGKAVLLRDGRRINGRWVRESVEGAVKFQTKDDEELLFAPGSIWVHLVPNQSGELKGSFSVERN
ncbi:MAG: DUF3048 domain-containing protein [Actinomycetota bacterium]